MDKQEFYLKRCSYMIGMTEAWILDKTIFVSPAVFQLLTDKEDPEMVSLVANQLTFKPVSYWEMDDLMKEDESTSSRPTSPEVMIHFVRMS